MNERKMTYAEKFAMHIEESCDPPGSFTDSSLSLALSFSPSPSLFLIKGAPYKCTSGVLIQLECGVTETGDPATQSAAFSSLQTCVNK